MRKKILIPLSGIIFCGIILFSGCASTTLIQSIPTGAKLYMAGEPVGNPFLVCIYLCDFLHGADLSGLFSSVSAKSEIVYIPVHSGGNVLILSLKGDLPGRFARDSNRPVLIVP